MRRLRLFCIAVVVVAKVLVDPSADHIHTQLRLGRCTLCGHRFGEDTRATREQPISTWPAEVWGRIGARTHHSP